MKINVNIRAAQYILLLKAMRYFIYAFFTMSISFKSLTLQYIFQFMH